MDRVQVRTIKIATTKIQVVMRELSVAMTDDLWGTLTAEERARYERITHPQRQLEWCEGRRALRALDPDTRFRSLAHSGDNGRGLALAVGANDLDLKGIGVDLEPSNRLISDSVAAWFIHGSESSRELSRLALWMVKEAAFKADPSKTEDFTLRDYEILPGNTNLVRALRGPEREFTFELFSEPPWSFAIVVSK